MKTKLLYVLLPLVLICSVNGQTQSELNEMASKDFTKVDAQLNVLYKKLLAEGDDASDERLREAQRAWLKYVELHMKYAFPLNKGENPREIYGSVYPMDYALTKVDLFQARILQLGGKISK